MNSFTELDLIIRDNNNKIDSKRALGELLVQLSDIEVSGHAVLVICTSNRMNGLDTALLRKFDVKVHFG